MGILEGMEGCRIGIVHPAIAPMRIWLISFGLLFGAVELYQWFKSLTVPFPLYVACGIALAIASNSEKLLEKFAPLEPESSQDATFVNPHETLETEGEISPQLPPSSISFKMNQPTWKKSSSFSSTD
jgi:hypothetical protein